MSMTDPLIGKKLGDYHIEGVLGTGGMARVYRGYDDNLDRYAAVKVIEPQLIASAEEDEYRERFLREARAIARLNHPNIVSIYQFNQVSSLYYIAMEYAEGDNLRDILKDYIRSGRIMPTSELLAVLSDIADALDYAHSQNIIHRDIKPSNIIVTQAQGAVLTDFGLALNAMEGTIGNTFGSVHYIAPEQAISSAQSVPQSDQYSLGIVAYELLTGRVPFDDASAMSVALKHISDPPPPPTELNPNIPAEVEQVLMRALDKEPGKRFPSAKEFVSAMELAFNMIDNVDIDAPETLTDAVEAPPDTKVLPPESEDDPTIAEASPPSPTATINQKSGRSGWFVAAVVVVIAALLGGYFFFTGIAEQNEHATGTAVAEERNLANTQMAETQVVDQTISAATRFAEATATAEEQLGQTATTEAQRAIVTETANAIQTENAIAQATSIAEATNTVAASETEMAQATLDAAQRQTEAALSTETAIAIATESVTDTPTQRPTETPSPTMTPTATDTPAPTATPSNTPIPTNTPLPSFAIQSDEDMRQILLRYDGRSLLITNRDTEQPIDVTQLRFILFVPDDEGELRRTPTNFVIDGSIFEDNSRDLEHRQCLMLLDNEVFVRPPSDYALVDDICDMSPPWLATSRTFWLSNRPEAYFEVRLGPVDVIGRCPTQIELTNREKRCALDIDFLP